jgi:hypothetical protein
MATACAVCLNSSDTFKEPIPDFALMSHCSWLQAQGKDVCMNTYMFSLRWATFDLGLLITLSITLDCLKCLLDLVSYATCKHTQGLPEPG